jgi:hypothetical protein
VIAVFAIDTAGLTSPPASTNVQTTVSDPYPSAVLADKPIAYWRLDDTSGTVAHDLVGLNNGAISGGVTLNQPGALADDSAMTFDGSSGFINLNGSPNVSTLSPAELTLEAWVRTSASSPSQSYVIVRNRTNTCCNQIANYSLALGTGSEAAFAVSTGSASNQDDNVTGGPALNDGQWHYIVGTHDDTSDDLYVDGTLVASTPDSSPIYYVTPVDVAIAQDGTRDADYFPGSLDEVAVYGHALSASQISAHYRAVFAWSIMDSPNDETGTGTNYLNGVSCTSSTQCVAVGSYVDAANQNQTLSETWTGSTWSIVLPPNGTSDQNNILYGVSCTSSTNCVAVGYQEESNVGVQTLIEIWNGSDWTIMPSPNQGTNLNQSLYGVSCSAANRCVAVGDYETVSNPSLFSCPGGSQTCLSLVEIWDGTRWSIASSPNPGPNGDFLYGVSCPSTSSCTATGYYSNGSIDQTLIENWNGATWSTTTSPNEGTAHNILATISCASASNCMTAGYYQNGSLTQQTLIERWDGTTWSITPSPNPGSGDNSVGAVSCPDTTGCVAVGSDGPGSDGSCSVPTNSCATLVETWNGTSWSPSSSPNKGAASNALSGVSCVTVAACVTVGVYGSASGVYQTLVETNH